MWIEWTVDLLTVYFVIVDGAKGKRALTAGSCKKNGGFSPWQNGGKTSSNLSSIQGHTVFQI